jgi:hypothetical protein
LAVISVDTYRLSHVVKYELAAELGYCRAVVTVNDTAATLAIGTVMGRVTSGGKYKKAVETAVDGSKVGAAIVVEAKTILGATDTPLLVLLRGPASVSKGALVIDATYNDATKLGVLYADLEAKGIQVLETV